MSGFGIVTTRDCADAFVTKVDGTGRLVFATYLSGPADDSVGALTVDFDGNVYVSGTTGGQCADPVMRVQQINVIVPGGTSAGPVPLGPWVITSAATTAQGQVGISIAVKRGPGGANDVTACLQATLPEHGKIEEWKLARMFHDCYPWPWSVRRYRSWRRTDRGAVTPNP